MSSLWTYWSLRWWKGHIKSLPCSSNVLNVKLGANQPNAKEGNWAINLVKNIWHTSQDPQYPHCMFEKCWLMIPTFQYFFIIILPTKWPARALLWSSKKMIKTFFSLWLYTIPCLIFCSKGSPWNHTRVEYKGILPLSYLLIDLENLWCRWSSNTSLYYISTLFALSENYNSTSRKSTSFKWSPTSS